MPIYAYRCESCGFKKDALQKLSDAPLSQCPECGRDTFRKQVTAAGFQLKGSGWYVTDFRGGNSGGNNQSEGGEGGASKAPAAKEAGSGSADGATSAGASTAPAAAGSATPSSNAGTSA
ncbi:MULTISPECIES: FmdB family zinc ribbon protein [Burkholderiaceae]|uniref:FmdB family zinc ribbon protein n=1 Tax=Burkholderiaceae TaxID=119060 RepID=UPI0009645294|nr:MULTISPECIES: FmdB family zinc ribbon protein [Burkholderiaceae]MCF2134908.1 zinc ribbon domain-containing protein [Mycetohabitans sp. B3]MCG1019421.1 zinc ribbon domain-containing protein [Mycetohabitans sp. B4]MCG1040228.1 zinc ribbon domain-containing protein [Mycetohabitans sp. B7]SIT72171.1 putative regulatory protein, FmdB family [Burkholderia sp. b13]SIT73273.1 putative regulatory protein, FmdB family [Burkholderia sp. b14]